MALVIYPPTLPEPVVVAVKAEERRALSALPGGREVRALQRDRLALQQLEFIFTDLEVEAFAAWVEGPLVQAGAWFGADWALPQGGCRARRFIEAPSYPQRLPDLGWRVQARCEVRGRGIEPVCGRGSGGTGAGGAAPPSIGWATATDQWPDFGGPAPFAGVFLHANTGSASSLDDDGPLRAAVVGYTNQTVVWTYAWLSPFDDPEPYVYPTEGRTEFMVYLDFFSARTGMLTVEATIDGEASDRIVLAIAGNTEGGYYSGFAWGPEP